ncbi:MAG: hypothetical protein VYE73_11035, partial [Acidobacteriota bacterium]|nr:hypothetical protein [Acidobacteriota bacterium]
ILVMNIQSFSMNSAAYFNPVPRAPLACTATWQQAASSQVSGSSATAWSATWPTAGRWSTHVSSAASTTTGAAPW